MKEPSEPRAQSVGARSIARRSRVALIAGLAALCLASAAAPPAGSATREAPASKRYRRIVAHADSLPYRAATSYLDSLATAAHADGNTGLEMTASLARSSRKAFVEGRFDEAHAEAERWIPAARAARDTASWCLALRTMGFSDLIRRRSPQALESYRQMLRLTRLAGLSTLEGYALLGTSYLAIYDGRLAEAERGYRRALKLLLAANEGMASRTARAGLANTLSHAERTDEARAEYGRVLAEARAAGDLRNVADALNDLGTIEFQHGDPSLAAPLFRESAVLQQRTGRRPTGLVSLTNLAICEEATGRAGEAAALYDTVIGEAAAIRAHDIVSRSLAGLATVRLSQARPAEAESLARRAVALRDSAGLASWGNALPVLAAALSARGRGGEARQLLEAALRTSTDAFWPAMRADLLYALGRADLESGDPRGALTPFDDAARLLRGSGGTLGVQMVAIERDRARAFLAIGLRDSALARFRLAAEIWETSRESPRDLSWREALGDAASRLYGIYAATVLDPGRGGSPAGRAEEAFAVLQRFRGRAFEDALHGDRRGPPPPRVTLEAFRRGALRPGEVYLDLFATADTGFVFAVTRDTVVAGGIPSRARLVPRLRRFRDLVADGTTRPEAIRDAARALGAEVLGPVPRRMRDANTVLIAAGVLGQYPLGMLMPPGEDQPIQATRTVAMVPSATLLSAARRESGSAGAARSSGRSTVAALNRTTDDHARRLDGVARESRWLQATFPGAEVRENDGRRSLDEMLTGLGTHEVLHVAAHTRGSADAPWRAGFLLGRGEDEDAYLTPPRIARLPRPARVCVLAGCASAGGANGAEAIPSLAAAWLAGGVSAVVATLWAVDDRATSDLMRDLYRELARGVPAGEALASAQREARERAGTPRDWSGFVLIGDPATRVALGTPSAPRPRARP